MMRAIRHAARNSFTIEQNTWNSIIKNREKLDLCPPSRIRDELLKDLSSGASEPWARLALKSGLFFVLFPFYREVFSADNGGDSERTLLSLLRVVDRLYQSGSEENRIDLPDYFLLAVFLMPWAEKRFNAMEKSLKGSAHYRMSRKIRSDLNEVLGERYNFKRMAKEAMTSLFVNFATLDQFSSKKSWPKWLRNKSYFPDGYRFYRLVAEAKGGTQADDNLFRIGRSTGRSESVFHGRQDYKKSSPRGRKGTRPAFTDQKKGVFGLRGR